MTELARFNIPALPSSGPSDTSSLLFVLAGSRCSLLG